MKSLTNKINIASEKAVLFTDKLKVKDGVYKYTQNHDINKHPAALLYGSWSVVYLRKLIHGNNWDKQNEKNDFLNFFNSCRKKNGMFLPDSLTKETFSKSLEYMLLHCYNYTVGAAIEIDDKFDFQSKYMDEFLNRDFLSRWLNQRSLDRPWEESNNIVNVASYLALCNDHGNSRGKEALYQMLEWHNKKQNPITGGFDCFKHSRKNILQSMAGAVHNFHIHKYLNEPFNYEEIIAKNVIPFLYEGPLTACLSIDFVELACATINHLDDSYELQQALIYHLDRLLKFQNIDGGWYENESSLKPTVANGMFEIQASSNSYSTWFRMCSIAMISVTLFNFSSTKWNFRKTLGMGYSNNQWNKIDLISDSIDKKLFIKNKIKNLPNDFKNFAINFAVKILK